MDTNTTRARQPNTYTRIQTIHGRHVEGGDLRVLNERLRYRRRAGSLCQEVLREIHTEFNFKTSVSTKRLVFTSPLVSREEADQ